MARSEKREKPKKTKKCDVCRGTGIMYFPGVTQPLSAECSWCKGTGRVPK